jgi:hypothetical protein
MGPACRIFFILGRGCTLLPLIPLLPFHLVNTHAVAPSFQLHRIDFLVENDATLRLLPSALLLASPLCFTRTPAQPTAQVTSSRVPLRPRTRPRLRARRDPRQVPEQRRPPKPDPAACRPFFSALLEASMRPFLSLPHYSLSSMNTINGVLKPWLFLHLPERLLLSPPSLYKTPAELFSLPTPSSLPPLSSLSLALRRREFRRRTIRAAPRRSPTGCQTPTHAVSNSSSDLPRPSAVHRSSARACAPYVVRHPWSLAGVRAPPSKRIAGITSSAVDATTQHTNWTIRSLPSERLASP